MFCGKCGNQMPDESTYCDNCGSSIETQSQTETVEELKEEKPKKAKKKKWLFLFIPVVVIAVLVICYFAFNICFPHEWTDATCTVPKTCTKCERTEGEAIGHKWANASCVIPKTCEVCEETEGEALGHTWKKATCILPKTCTVCNEEEGSALGHKWDSATCTKAKTCSVCGEIEGDALGHKWDSATCTKAKTCSVCGKTEGEPLGHDLDETKTCKRCGEVDGIAYYVEDLNGKTNLVIYGNRTLKENDVPSDVVESAQIITIKGNITGIGDNCFDSYWGLGDNVQFLVIEDSVTGKICRNAFNTMRKLEKVTIGSGITEIGFGAFERCSSLESVNGCASVKKVEDAAFNYCNALTYITLPEDCSFEPTAFMNSKSTIYLDFGTRKATYQNGEITYLN